MIVTAENRDVILRRFEDGYEPEPNSGCWLWIGKSLTTGYGQIRVGEYWEYKLAHRVSYELFIGDLATGLQIRHKCDTPCCVNPDHLLVGTDQDNRSDMAKRGRGSSGTYPVGVFPHKKKFQAKVKFRGQYRYLGVFQTIEEAAAAVTAERRKLYG